MKKGQQHKVVVHAVANSGDGVGRIDEKVVFIPFAVPGDTLLVEITENKKSFGKARIVKILNASKDRREAPCPYFGKCGGCHWQNMDESLQRDWKTQNLKDVLRRIGKIEDLSFLKNCVASPKNLGYRNRIQLHQGPSGWFYLERNSKNPVPIEKCLLAADPINDFLQTTKSSSSHCKIELAAVKGEVQVFSVDNKGKSHLGFRQVNDGQNEWLKNQVIQWVQERGCHSVIDLFCGQGNWSRALSSSYLKSTALELTTIQ